jgi:Tol biopolymer transport system component
MANMHRREFLFALGGLALNASSARPIASPALLAGTLRQLTQPGGGDNRATYMPDGNRLLFASTRTMRSQIWCMDLDRGDTRQLIESQANDYGRVPPSPDGTRVCFSSDRNGQNAIYVLDLRTGATTLISDPVEWSFGPTWSSRDEIAYFSRKGGNRLNIWTVHPGGSEARQITDRPGESRQPWWSPDGRTLALSADNGTGMFQIWLMAEDGSEARAITARGNWQQPFWGPDGRHIVVSAKLDFATFRILVIDPEGGDMRQISQPADVDNVHPAWSPDGRSIVFTSGAGKAAALWRFAFAK